MSSILIPHITYHPFQEAPHISPITPPFNYSWVQSSDKNPHPLIHLISSGCTVKDRSVDWGGKNDRSIEDSIHNRDTQDTIGHLTTFFFNGIVSFPFWHGEPKTSPNKKSPNSFRPCISSVSISGMQNLYIISTHHIPRKNVQ